MEESIITTLNLSIFESTACELACDKKKKCCKKYKSKGNACKKCPKFS
jgi:hypothetical protein